jgi:hypothetical protein
VTFCAAEMSVADASPEPALVAGVTLADPAVWADADDDGLPDEPALDELPDDGVLLVAQPASRTATAATLAAAANTPEVPKVVLTRAHVLIPPPPAAGVRCDARLRCPDSLTHSSVGRIARTGWLQQGGRIPYTAPNCRSPASPRPGTI